VVAVITNWRLMDAALIQRLHAQGWRALVYTVNGAPVAERLIADGIDGLITDRVDQLGPV
jgi:glycerophosphoryl diester phosphodiesterase